MLQLVLCVCMWFRYTCLGVYPKELLGRSFLLNVFGDHTSYQNQYQTNWLLGTLLNNQLITACYYAGH
jgi:hypothetical protein